MIFNLKVEAKNAPDIGYLLHKNPNKVHQKKLPFGTSYVFYPIAENNICSMVFLLDIDPLALARGRSGRPSYPLYSYVNDRPYVTSSFMSVAIAQAFGTALNGNCKKKPDLVNKIWPAQIFLPAVPARGGEKFLRKLFEPLEYKVFPQNIPLDKERENWGDSPYFSVTLKGNHTIQNILNHLYILFPVLDSQKHYWINELEIEKLIARGGEWLKKHPLKEEITTRYLINLKGLVRSALAILMEKDEETMIEAERENSQKEQIIEKELSLDEIRMSMVIEKLKEHEVSRLIDMGCGEGKLLKSLLSDKSFKKMLGVDVSARALNIAKAKLKWHDLPDRVKSRIDLIAGSVIYRDRRFNGFDAMTLIEVIEHIDLNRLIHLERSVFEFASPGAVIITTPNREYNKNFENLREGQMRHNDHRFEWTREEFENWAKEIAKKYSYQVNFFSVGPAHKAYGSPTQMGVFKK